MNLACQKSLGDLQKVLGIGVPPPPHFGKNSQKIPFFLNESPPNQPWSPLDLSRSDGLSEAGARA